MKLKLLTAAASAALMMAPMAAQADGHDHDDKGWYLRGNAGYGFHTDVDHSGIITGDSQSKGSIPVSLGFGYDLGNAWRLELDGTTFWSDLGSINNSVATRSTLRTNSLMLNAIYDFEDFGNWEPYVGAGLGKMRATASSQASGFFNPTTGVFNTNPVCSTRASCTVRDKDNAWAWQLLAGVGYDISDRLTWDTQYRFQKSFEDLGFNGTTVDGFSPNLTTANGEMFMEDVGAHMLMTGLRYKLGKPTPKVTCWDGSMVKMIGDCPVQPKIITCWDGSSFEEGSGGTCPDRRVITCWDGSSYQEGSGGTCPPERQTFVCWDDSVVYDTIDNCPTETRSGLTTGALCANQYRQEIIYYEFDKGQSPETRSTINRILDVGDFCNVDTIRVVGHTDTSGAASYNLALSQRRAKDARDELVRQGINPTVISSEGKGETEPFVPTGDGVKEQLNRRTEVLITLSEVGAIVN
ncbi:MAG: OmpA family protein [Hellea sp.]|nr:OmpA family protein [Hellea sp.]